MSADTITVDAELDHGPRVKRLKTGKSGTSNHTTFRFQPAYQPRQRDSVNWRRSVTSNAVTVGKENKGKQAIRKTNNERSVSRGTSGPAFSGDIVKRSNHDESQIFESRTPPRILRSDIKRPTSPTPVVNFSKAPEDPIGLTWWLAQQMARLENSSTTNMDQDCSSIRSRQSRAPRKSHPPSTRTSKSLDAIRVDNRQRKAQWRATNAERNRDNDLRSRVNKIANKKFGPNASREKTAYVESEYQKRRTKRETRQRTRAIENGGFPRFQVNLPAKNDLFQPENRDSSRKVQAAGSLLTKLLFSDGKDYVGERTRAAEALRSSLDHKTTDESALTEALKMMSTNRDIMNGIHSGLGTVEEDDDDEMTGTSEGALSLRNTAPEESDFERAASVGRMITNEQSTDMIQAMNAAMVLVHDIANAKTYSSPYTRPPPHHRTEITRPRNEGGSTTQREPASAPSASEAQSMDTSQIDALLMLANGGSLMDVDDDDDDEKTIADPNELDGLNSSANDTRSLDTEVTSNVEAFIERLISERSTSAKTAIPNSTIHDGLAYNLIQEQAVQLREHFARTRFPVNVVMPESQGTTTSLLYNVMIDRFSTVIPNGKVRPANHADHNADDQAPQPSSSIQLPTNSSASTVSLQEHSSPSAPTSPMAPGPSSTLPETNGVVTNGPPVQLFGARSEEEQQRIRSYGFPPPPGSRVGVLR